MDQVKSKKEGKLVSRMFKSIDQTWNVFVGCDFECSYCNARELALTRLRHTPRYKDGFKPHLVESELNRQFKPGQFIFVCVDPSTLILMADSTEKAVSEVRKGEWIIGVADGKTIPSLVMASNKRQSNQIYEITTDAGKTINCSPDHPFLTPVGYLPASRLREGFCVIVAYDDEIQMDRNRNSIPAGELCIHTGQRDCLNISEVGSRSEGSYCKTSQEEPVFPQEVEEQINQMYRDIGESNQRGDCLFSRFNRRGGHYFNSEFAERQQPPICQHHNNRSASYRLAEAFFLAEGAVSEKPAWPPIFQSSPDRLWNHAILGCCRTLFSDKETAMPASEEIYNAAASTEMERKTIRGNVGIKERYQSLKLTVERLRHIKVRDTKEILYDLTTTTENFVANGFVTHNCYMGDISFATREEFLRILSRIRQFPETLFLIQTKNPKQLYDWRQDWGIILPPNVYLGTTIETNRNYGVTKAPAPIERFRYLAVTPTTGSSSLSSP